MGRADVNAKEVMVLIPITLPYQIGWYDVLLGLIERICWHAVLLNK